MELRDLDEEDPLDVEASKYGLNYIKLDGNVGCIVNGAGLAMATMDIIKLAGGEPANFLDVGGGACPSRSRTPSASCRPTRACRPCSSTSSAASCACDRLAEGVISAVRKLGLELPVVVRMEGTNVEQGRKMLAESGLTLIMADDMGEGGAQGRRAGPGRAVDEHSGRPDHARARAGHHRPGGHVPRRRAAGVRHQVVGGVTPGKGGTTHEGFPVWNTVAEAVQREPAPTARSSSCRRRPPPTPSWRRPPPACR